MSRGSFYPYTPQLAVQITSILYTNMLLNSVTFIGTVRKKNYPLAAFTLLSAGNNNKQTWCIYNIFCMFLLSYNLEKKRLHIYQHIQKKNLMDQSSTTTALTMEGWHLDVWYIICFCSDEKWELHLHCESGTLETQASMVQKVNHSPFTQDLHITIMSQPV